jgi:signal transduction histidine kinase/ligand-binding sensor domain-containing protein
LIYVLSAFPLAEVFSQIPIIPEKIIFENLSIEDGLINNSVSCVARDGKGFVWVGTPNGLCRYDGYEFKCYLADPGDTTSLSGNIISSILHDSKDRLWIATLRNGFNLYDRENDSFHQFKSADIFGYNLIRTIFEDSRGRILIGTFGSGLILFHPGTKKYSVVDSNNTDGVSSNFVNGICEDTGRNIWLSHIDGSITRLDPELTSAKTFVYNASEYDNPYHPFRGSIFYQDNALWISNSPEGLIRFDLLTETFDFFPVIANGQGLYSNDVLGIAPYDNDYLWVAIDHGGLNLINTKTHETIYYLQNPSDPKSLVNNQVNCIYKDSSDIYWLGNYKGGLNYFTPSRSAFTNYVQDGSERGLSARSVTCIYEDRKERIWIGTDGGGLNRLDKKNNLIRTYRHDPARKSSLSSDLITCVIEDSSGQLWVGTFSGGLNAFDPETNTAIRYGPNEPANRYLNSYVVENVMEAGNGDLWLSTLNKGIFRKEKEKKSFENITQLAGESLISLAIITILEDHLKRIWIGFDDIGVLCYDPTAESLESYANIPNDSTSISSPRIAFIYEDKQHRLWVGTPNGLNIFNEAQKNFRRINQPGKFPTNTFSSMLEDEAGNYWIGSISGIIKFNMHNGETRVYDYSDGLQGNEFNTKAALIDHEGMFFFGGTKGVSSFYPDQIKEFMEEPPIVITDFFLRNKQIDNKSDKSPLKKPITETEKIVLNFRQNHIGFKFAALSYLHTEKNYYAYYLEPLEREYNFVGHQRTANYANLAPGTYIFRVKGSNSDLVWNNTGRSIEVVITPPFWMTLWFRILSLFLILATIYLIYYLRIMAIKSRNRKLEELVNEQTNKLRSQNIRLLEHSKMLNESNSELEERQQKIQEQAEEIKTQSEAVAKINAELRELNSMKDRFFSIIAHDLKNPFNTIFGFAELLKIKRDSISAKKRDLYIETIYSSTRKIYSLLENLLLWSRTQSDHLVIKPELFRIDVLFDEVMSLLSENAGAKDIILRFDAREAVEVFADRDMVSTILRNLLSNSIKYTPVGGSVTLEAATADHKAIISVVDTGVGITLEDQGKLFRIDEKISTTGTEGEEGTGLGLVLCKEFVEKSGGTIWVDSEVNKGTRFVFTLPLTKPEFSKSVYTYKN